MQVTTSLAMGYSVRMPDLFRQFAGILGLANLDMFQLIPIECYMEHCGGGRREAARSQFRDTAAHSHGPCYHPTLTLPCHGLPRRICSPR